MTQLVDDRLLGSLLVGAEPPLPDDAVHTTGYWYVRLCQAALGASGRAGALSSLLRSQPRRVRERAVGKLLQLPDEIGLVSLRTLGPLIGRLRCHHRLNALGMEALAAAVHLDAEVLLTSPSPRLQEALKVEGVRVQIVKV